ncbi:hypothetical protein BC936DRAFT_137276, partial [Jimgerdemannia flammicorona]
RHVCYCQPSRLVLCPTRRDQLRIFYLRELQTMPSTTKRHRQIVDESDDEDPPQHKPRRPSTESTRSKRVRYRGNDNDAEADHDVDGDFKMLEEEDEVSDEFEMQDDDDEGGMMQQEAEPRRQKRRGYGEAAESGVIERIELTNFMCHKYLKVPFGPKLNFVIGHNGSEFTFAFLFWLTVIVLLEVSHNKASGKSAILTGITVALGAKATVTNRASNLKSLIREGASAGQVCLTLRNGGPDAYRAEVYGHLITIERRITKEGSNGYKIKSANGTTISTKREDLTAICDHMGIQVDNPLTVLSQDTARQFLSSSTAEEKFKFFMKGTQLTQLCEDYEIIRESIATTKAIITRKKTMLPELEREAREARTKLKDMQEAHQLNKRLEDLKKECCWAQIKMKEEEVEKAEQNKLKAQNKVREIDAKLAEERQKLEDVKQEITGLENQLPAQAAAARPIQDEKRQLLEGMKERRRQLTEYNVAVRQIRQRIEEETRKLEASGRRKRDAVLAQVAELKVEIDAARGEAEQTRAELKENAAELEQVAQLERETRQKVDKTRNDIGEAETTIRDLRGQQEDRVRAFGNQMPDILRDIAQERGFRVRPVGPIGMYVRVTRPEWIPVLEAVIGNSLNNFVCENHDDAKLLMNILSRRNWGDAFRFAMGPRVVPSILKSNTSLPQISKHINVSIFKRDLFDFSSGQPDRKFMAMLDVLEFDDEWVKRVMVVNNSIESIILVDRRTDGDAIMYTNPRNVTRCFSKDLYQLGMRSAGMRTQTVREYRGRPRFTRDVEPQILETQRTLQELQNTLQQHQMQVQDHIRRSQALQRQKSILKNNLQTFENTIRNGVNRVDQLQEQLQQDEPANIQALEEDKQETERQIAMILNQLQVSDNHRETLQAECRQVEAHVAELNKRLDNINIRSQEIKAEVEDKFKEKMEAQNKVSHWERRHAEQNERIRNLQNTYDEVTNELQASFAHMYPHSCAIPIAKFAMVGDIGIDWMAKAIDYCPERVEVTKPLEQLERDITSLKVRLRESERESGADLETVSVNAKNKVKAYKVAMNDLEVMDNFVKRLNASLNKRVTRLEYYKSFIATRISYIFMYYLSTRNFRGDVRVNYKFGKLKLKVASGDAEQKRVTRDKDPRSLSGGEKSFSTLCLLLAIWDGVACPIRCLDEFDVFMDAVNRRISMGMMIQTAQESTAVQYILITPQDASGLTPSQDVRIHRLADPERNQATLDA